MKLKNWKQLLNEGQNLVTESNDKVFVLKTKKTDDGNIWISYRPNSGNDLEIKNISKSFNSTDSDIKNNNTFIVDLLNKWSLSNKPLKTIQNKKMYKIPVYIVEKNSIDQQQLQSWGGDISPDSYYYFIITTNKKGSSLQIFNTKKEADFWLKKEK